MARREQKRTFSARSSPLHVPNRTRQLRTSKRWSQGLLAQKLGVARQTIHAIENGRSVPSLELALKLARVFGCPVEALFESKLAPETPPACGLSPF